MSRTKYPAMAVNQWKDVTAALSRGRIIGGCACSGESQRARGPDLAQRGFEFLDSFGLAHFRPMMMRCTRDTAVGSE
jgi:hypothetical protein